MPPTRTRDSDVSKGRPRSGVTRFQRKSIIGHDLLSSNVDHDSFCLTAGISSDYTAFSKKGRGSKSTKPPATLCTEAIVIKGVQLKPTVVFDTFWRFAAKRKAIDDRRRSGMPQP